MKNLIVATIALTLSASSLFAANTPVQHKTKTDTVKMKSAKVKVQYVCPMHPNEISDKPGKCHVCGMALVKKETSKKQPATDKMKM